MSFAEKQKWQEKYEAISLLPRRFPANWLLEWASIIPRGKILDLGIGLGANALYLASLGCSVFGIDISEKAIRAVKQTASRKSTELHLVVADLDVFPIPAETFDGVLSFFYLNRCLFPQIKKCLKPGGVVLMETYVDDSSKEKRSQVSHCLQQSELASVFGDLEILSYAEGEESFMKDMLQTQWRGTARICARRVK